MYAQSKKNPSWSYDQAFQRNIGLTTHLEQEVLRNATIAIPGLGGVGGAHLVTLARLGIGNFHIADQDVFDVANFNRQAGAFVSTIGQEKTVVMENMLRDINPEAQVRTWTKFINESNVDAFLDGVDLVIDSVDAFAIAARLLIFRRAYEKGIPVISAGPIGFSTAVLIQTPDSWSLDKYLAIDESMDDREMFGRFVAGLTPKPLFLKYMVTGNVDIENQRGPSLASSISLCAGVAATEATKLLLRRGRVRGLPHYHYFDPYLGVLKQGRVAWGNRNPLQRLKIWYILKYKLPAGPR